MAYRFVCNHCGKSFENGDPEVKECPFCFWSTSVKREDELAAEKAAPPSQGSRSKTIDYKKLLFAGLKIVFWVALAAAIVYVGLLLYSKWEHHRMNKGPSVSILASKKSDSSKGLTARGKDGQQILNAQEKEALFKEIPLPEKPVPSEGEKVVLFRSVKFKTGWSEQLPSPAWTLPQYEQMLAEQERFYKVTLPRSYKKKLKDLFESKYLAGADAFTKGDPLAARNLFVVSLGFPLYSTNLQKHRGVALTMLKPFINDTLSKIGALNQSIVDKGKRLKEEAITSDYQSLMDSLQGGNWKEALSKIENVEASVTQIQEAAQKTPAIPSYPPAIGAVDQDIQRTLAELSAPNASSVADFLNVREDLAQKKDILAEFSDEQYQKSVMNYKEGLSKARGGDYEGAYQSFSTIRGPEFLRNDVQAKLLILGKLIHPVEQPPVSNPKA